MADGRLHIFGIRHHGPGSAHCLERALDALDPAVVLIEGPPEADALIPMAASPEMEPPVALLVYAVDEPALASFYPLAAYSPEWRAMLWAVKRGRPVRFIDLPVGVTLAIRRAEARAELEAANAPEATDAPGDGVPHGTLDDVTPGEEAHAEEGAADRDGQPAEQMEAIQLRRDPLAYLAELAGYEDSESWWNALVEQGAHGQQTRPDEIFAAIEAAMTAIREEVEARRARQSGGARVATLREDQREAYMRLAIGAALKENSGATAVVCGAWHVPALRRKVAKAQDKELLKSLPKLGVAATWAPWTSARLTLASGYGAGVTSPGWYSHLWSELQGKPDSGGEPPARTFTARWQTRVADLLRQSGRITATALVIEAARLAEALAALRGLSLPGLDEMREASLATLCHGESAPLRLIDERLVVGNEVGTVDPGAPQTPLQADLTRWQKRLKLKPKDEDAEEISLDLRTEAGLAKSTLLNRLALLGVDWGRPLDPGGSRGAFRERWQLRWDPDFSVRLAEAIIYGSTIELASGACAVARARDAATLTEKSDIVRACLLADLDEAAREAIHLLQAAAAVTTDIGALAGAAPPLASILRYGTARKLPEDELRLLATSLIEAICAGLLYACRNIEEAAARDLRDRLTTLNRSIPLLDDERLSGDWRRALDRLAEDESASPLLQGFAARALYDQSALDPSEIENLLSRALSPSVAAAAAGQWLDGFLADGGQMLLHDDRLLAIIDGWLVALAEEDFIALLPMLRRAFSNCDLLERRRLLDAIVHTPRALARTENSSSAGAGASAETSENFTAALPLLLAILGLHREENAQ